MRFVVRFSLIIGLIVGSIYLANVIQFLNIDTLSMTLGISIIFSVVLFFIDFVGAFIYKRKYNEKNFQKNMEDLKEKSDKDILNYQDSNKRLKRVYLFVKSFIILLIILMFIVMTLSIAVMMKLDDLSEIFIFYLLALYILIGLIIALTYELKIDKGFEILQSDYPVIYQTLLEVKRDLNVKEDIHLHTDVHSNAIIFYNEGSYRINIGIFLLLMLNKEELKSVFYHELGHLIHKDSYLKAKRIGLIDAFSPNNKHSGWIYAAYLWIFALINYLTNEYEIHSAIISKEDELRSDEIVLNHHLNQAYISAGIKLNYFEYFFNDPTTHVNLLEKEELTETLWTDFYQAFLTELPNKMDKYQNYIQSEIEPKRSSHPTLRTRMKNFGVDSLDHQPFESYDKNEVEKLLKVIQEVNDTKKTSYLIDRQKNYLDPLTRVREFEQSPSTDENRLITHGIDLFSLRRYDESLNIFNQIYTNNPKNATACFYIGLIKLNIHDDKSGIEDVYKAVELSNDHLNAIELIAEYSRIHGLQEELDKAKDYMIKMQQKLFDNDYHKALELNIKAHYEPTDIQEKHLKIIDRIMTKYNFKAGYAIKRKMKDGNYVSIIYFCSDRHTKNLNDAYKAIEDELIGPDFEFYTAALFTPGKHKLLNKYGNLIFERKKNKIKKN